MSNLEREFRAVVVACNSGNSPEEDIIPAELLTDVGENVVLHKAAARSVGEWREATAKETEYSAK